jgi:hypothetical protein
MDTSIEYYAYGAFVASQGPRASVLVHHEARRSHLIRPFLSSISGVGAGLNTEESPLSASCTGQRGALPSGGPVLDGL